MLAAIKRLIPQPATPSIWDCLQLAHDMGWHTHMVTLADRVQTSFRGVAPGNVSFAYTLAVAHDQSKFAVGSMHFCDNPNWLNVDNQGYDSKAQAVAALAKALQWEADRERV